VYEIENREGNKWREVRLTAKETPGKESKKGRFQVSMVGDKIMTFPEGSNPAPNLLQEWSCNGNMCRPSDTIAVIRARINEHRRLMNY
jgi:hypothetical protein